VSADTPPPTGSILVQVDASRANGLQQSSLVCAAPDQPIDIPYDRGPGDLGDLYFHVAQATGNAFAGTTAPRPDPPLQWHVYGFTPSFDSALADGMIGNIGRAPDLYTRTGSSLSIFYGHSKDLKIKIKIDRNC
jgi:hypothetical protein